MSLGDQAVRGTALTMAVQLGRAALQFGSTVVLARLLLPADFGLVAMVTAVVGIADLLRDFGLSMAVARAKSVSHGERTNLFWVNLGVGVVCALIAWACTPLIVAAYDEPRLADIIPVFAGLVIVGGFNAQFRADLVRTMRFKAIGLTDLTAQLIGVACGIGLAMAGAGLWAIVAQQALFNISSAVMNVISTRWWPSLPQRHVSIRHFLRFGGGVLGTHLIIFLTRNLDNIAIGAFRGPTALGLYERGYQLMMMPLAQINTPMTQVAVPTLTRVQHDKALLLRYLLRAQQVGGYVTATVFCLAAGLAAPIVDVLFGAEWTDVAPIFAILAIGGVFRAISQISYWLYLVTGKSGALFRQRVVTGLLTIVSIGAGVPWGALGVSVGVTVSSALTWLIGLWHAGRTCDVPWTPLLSHAARVVATVGAPIGLIGYGAGVLPWNDYARIAAGLVGGLAWMVIIRLLSPAVRRDLDDVVSVIRRAVPRRPAAVAQGVPPTIDADDAATVVGGSGARPPTGRHRAESSTSAVGPCPPPGPSVQEGDGVLAVESSHQIGSLTSGPTSGKVG